MGHGFPAGAVARAKPGRSRAPDRTLKTAGSKIPCYCVPPSCSCPAGANVGSVKRITVTRNARGKVTLAFTHGLQGLKPSEVLGAMERILKDLG